MDIHMPVMDGIEATEKMLDMGVKAPIVAMTANVMSDDTELYSISGMNDYIGKPFASQDLWKCLLRHLVPVSWQNGASAQRCHRRLRQKLFYERSVPRR